jgi:hypothetical protein
MKTQQTSLARLLTLAASLALTPACVAELGGEDDALAFTAEQGDEKAIVGGADVAIADHPWQISLQADGFHFCGGSIISDRWIVTAQHCIDGEVASRLTVVAGTSRLSRASSGQSRRVARIIPVSGYSTPERGKDVALLELASPLTLGGSVQAIGIATAADNVTSAGLTATVTGWGTLRSGGSSPDTLKGVNVPLVDMATAQRVYGSLTADQLAAGGDGRDSCQGDSGGPLTVNSARGRLLVGVVSWGAGCGDPGVPGMYARVPAFADWIAQQTGIGGSTTTTPPPAPTPEPTTTVLLDRTVNGARGSFTHTSITVPSGKAVLEVEIAGSNGDADLYVRRGSASTATRFDCRPYTNSSTERCVFEAPAGGTWVVSVAGYSAYSNLRVTAQVR